MGCSALVGITLFGGFLKNASLDSSQAEDTISLNNPQIFAGLLIGAIFPFIISGLTVRGSRKTTRQLTLEIQNQLLSDEGIAR
jgi:Na+/H+-translocating membrane pyrophosphatase